MENLVFKNVVEEALKPGVSVYEALSRALTATMVHNGRESVSYDIVAQRWHYPLGGYYSIPTWNTLKHDLNLAAKGSLSFLSKIVNFSNAQEDDRVTQFARKALTNIEAEVLIELNKQATARGFRKRSNSASKNYIQFVDENYPKVLVSVKEAAVLKARWNIKALERQQADALDCAQTRDWAHKCSHYTELVKDLKAIGADSSVIEAYSVVVYRYRTQLDQVELRYAYAIKSLEDYVEKLGLGVKLIETT